MGSVPRPEVCGLSCFSGSLRGFSRNRSVQGRAGQGMTGLMIAEVEDKG